MSQPDPPLPATATTDEVVARMDEHGYAVVERLLPAEQVAAIKADLEQVLADVPLGRNDFEGFRTKRIYNLFAKTRAMDDVALHPLLLPVLLAITVPVTTVLLARVSLFRRRLAGADDTPRALASREPSEAGPPQRPE